jgi:hypothetical protein
MSQFAFLQAEWAALFEAAAKAEAAVQGLAIWEPVAHLQDNDIFVLTGEDGHSRPWSPLFDGRHSCAP